jgi:hypothetical protein
MGFGGGAMIGAPLADKLMKFFATPDSVGVRQTFLVMAAIYFVFMMAGALSYRVPPSPPPRLADRMVDGRRVRTPAGDLHPRIPDRPRRIADGAKSGSAI